MKSILQEKKPETERLITRISPDTHGALEALTVRLDQEAPHLQFTVDELVEKAVRSAVRKANKELDAMHSANDGH